jgi:hypothetical protein
LVPARFRGRVLSYSRGFLSKPFEALWREVIQEWYPHGQEPGEGGQDATG